MSALAAVFHDQAGHCEALGSPFTARLLRVLADQITPGTPLMDRLLAWPGDIGPKGASVPLRMAGALHSLVRLNLCPELTAIYPPQSVEDDVFRGGIAKALFEHEPHIDAWINEAPQTNEVRRSAVLIALGHWLTAHYDLPLALSEMGASGGLNLMWDRVGLDLGTRTYGPDAELTLTPEWTGPLPPYAPPSVLERRGVDVNPLDPKSADGELRLMSYLWADQTDRLERTRLAISLAEAEVDGGDAAHWVERRLATASAGRVHLLYSTIAFQYFPDASQRRITQAVEKAGDSARGANPLAWFSMENDGATAGAALTLRLWPGDFHINLGRADFHGRWVNWNGINPKTLEVDT